MRRRAVILVAIGCAVTAPLIVVGAARRGGGSPETWRSHERPMEADLKKALGDELARGWSIYREPAAAGPYRVYAPGQALCDGLW